ncbi:hypothetical protein R5O87_03915 [Arthrobacter globiformis]|uniref:hypothetical protein n=1 Tax=Arthrobacter globiformis TaxID=1665 RepID=UPI0039783908
MAVQPLQAGGRRRFAAIDKETLRSQLALNRQHIAQADTNIRTAMGHRNETVAQALADRVAVAAIAEAAGVKKVDVRRRLGLGYADLAPLGWRTASHLSAIRSASQTLAAAIDRKSELEARRRSLTVMALKSNQLDLFEIASLAAIPVEIIRSEMRGITLRSVRLTQQG